MPKLTDTQRVILTAAAKRDGGTILPLPATLKLNNGSAATVFKSLLARGLIAEHTAGTQGCESDDQSIAHTITQAGLAAIGIDPEPATKSDTLAAAKKAPAKRATKPREQPTPASEQPVTMARTGTKQALLIDLLRPDDGATVAEIGDATGWQAHSVRGAISGSLKKKLGLSVTSYTVEGRGRVYRIAADT